MNAKLYQTIEWDAVVGADSYEVQSSGVGGTPLLGSNIVSVPAISVAAAAFGTVAGGSFQIKVRAVDASGPGDWSVASVITIDKLPAPLNFRVTG